MCWAWPGLSLAVWHPASPLLGEESNLLLFSLPASFCVWYPFSWGRNCCAPMKTGKKRTHTHTKKKAQPSHFWFLQCPPPEGFGFSWRRSCLAQASREPPSPVPCADPSWHRDAADPPEPSPGASEAGGSEKLGRRQHERRASAEKRDRICPQHGGGCCLGEALGTAGGPALTGFEEDDLVVLAELHEAVDALGELHHVLDGVGDLQRALLPHGLAALWAQRGHPLGLAAAPDPCPPPSPPHGAGKGPRGAPWCSATHGQRWH